MFLPMLLSPLLLYLLPVTAATDDKERLGALQATLPLRYFNGLTLVNPGLGTPPQNLPLVLSPDVGHLSIVGHCGTCIHRGGEYDVASSSTARVQDDSSFNLTLPGRDGDPGDSLALSGMIVNDRVHADGRPLELPEGVCSIHKIMSIVNTTNDPAALPEGSSGYWGLGIDESDLNGSLIPSACPPNGSVTVGFDLKNSTPAGEMHWGGPPPDAYVGRFNWLPTSEANWAVGIEGFRVNRTKINAPKSSYAILDPGLDGIYVPSAIAEQVYGALGGKRDHLLTNRWNVPCNASAEIKVVLGGIPYVLATSSLIVPRDSQGWTCWGSMMSWANASLPETHGEIRLGAPFLSGVYMALYYPCSSEKRYVGLAAKPGSANPSDPFVLPKPDLRVVGIVLGVLLPLLLLLLGLCFLKNRCSPLGLRQRFEYNQAMQAEAQAHAHETATSSASHSSSSSSPTRPMAALPIVPAPVVPPAPLYSVPAPAPAPMPLPVCPPPVPCKTVAMCPPPCPPPVCPPPVCPPPVCTSVPVTYGFYTQYSLPIAPVAPIAPVVPLMPLHSAQPWMHTIVSQHTGGADCLAHETLGEAWLRRRRSRSRSCDRERLCELECEEGGKSKRRGRRHRRKHSSTSSSSSSSG
ncbi:acid protease [Cutaneotrichosporon oleaginosum]|uniref:Acid protease n=1 Tax=Cutaneotrichosporon oleaginosum TaxID=879819 RepID=A0A0J0XKP5_9TREE|nr:acid protease [Cutaneotrichosporon oleaginosum]KLT41665.1 acid protease [Cutaneotrichosporon oleaginosum]TXT08037.1 hypothetical protein COLE_04961 [Cutaneotrichosporon oleaginosum]